jgi:hypothetical protein
MTRRSWLAGSAAFTVLAACGRSEGPGSTSSRLQLEPGGDEPVLIAGFAYGGNYLVTGTPQRMTFLVGLGGTPITETPPELEFRLSLDDRVIGDAVVVARHDDGVPIPYFPLQVTFDAPGLYTATVDIDGTAATQTFQVDEPATVALVQPGAALPALETPTDVDHRGVEPICTREPTCSLHTQTLADALGSGRPVAFLVATPEFCQTATCGPVLDLLLEAVPAHAEVQFVHAEVYRDAAAVGNVSNAQIAPAVEDLGLTFEPSLFVADTAGTVRARLDNVYDRVELQQALASVS